MSRVNALLLLLVNSLKVNKIADSSALHLVARCGCFVCYGGVWISTPCCAGLFSVCTDYDNDDDYDNNNNNNQQDENMCCI
jgi:hypothetical protein